MLTRADVEARFRALLVEAGIDLERPTSAAVERAWEVMWRFGAEPIEGAVPPEGDGVSAGYGLHELPTGEVYFELTMTRQLTFYDDDAYQAMTHLYCSFQYLPTPELRRIGAGETGFEEALDADWDGTMGLRGYRAVRELGAQPVALAIEFTEA